MYFFSNSPGQSQLESLQCRWRSKKLTGQVSLDEGGLSIVSIMFAQAPFSFVTHLSC